MPTIKIYGPADRVGVIAFNLGEHHAYDVGSFLDQYGIAIRTGHHCAMPLMAFYQVPSMCRASLALYNTQEEVALSQHLTPSRSQGVEAMIRAIRRKATQLL